MKLTAREILSQLKSLSQPGRTPVLQKFFKTGKGEYAEGDVFLGLKVPELREMTKEYRELPLSECLKLLQSKYHEARLLALFIMNWQFKKGDEKKKKEIFEAYLRNTKQINNWDLVDSSAEHIVGAWLNTRDRKILFKLAGSSSLWERRIATLSCFHFIRNKDFDTALAIARELVNDREDLIHKAVGWMLREIGERDPRAERKFLNEFCATMPRTMLRYAIEKFEPGEKARYMNAKATKAGK